MLRINLLRGDDVFTTRNGIEPDVVYNRCGVGNIQHHENINIVFSGEPNEVARSRLLDRGYVVDIDKVRATAAIELAEHEYDYTHEPNTVVVQVYSEKNISVIHIRNWMDLLANSRHVWMNMRYAIAILDEMMCSHGAAREYINKVLATDAGKLASDQGVMDLDKAAKILYTAHMSGNGNSDDVIRLYALYLYTRTHGEVNDLI